MKQQEKTMLYGKNSINQTQNEFIIIEKISKCVPNMVDEIQLLN